MQQKRLIIALLISTAILFLWSYLVPTKPPAQTPAVSNQATPQPAASAATTPATASTPLPAASPSVATNTTPHRTITIKTPLYETKLDSVGAEAISWIIKKNKDSGQD